ncbi:spore maturation protein CgeB [Paenibacillus taihuensis]|uniref:Spore maturation protein CgeB n=1 Tax=Paenibacillus taihuensis TaxID=1156355 RepID=A0A3D9SN25_9BACL|nr:glycosyltransferase [Paenibacillus taihuensis]REE90519.1 spore maturation protein CgeB [Paenibacillus taihuensis]
MDNNRINARLHELKQKELRLRSEVELKDIKYNQADWFAPAHVKLNDSEVVIEDNVDHCYLSYLELNNSFNLTPKKSVLKSLFIYKKLNVHFTGEVNGDCDIRLVVITYLNQEKKNVYSVSLNSNLEIPIHNEQDIRIALRIQGNGRFVLSSIKLEPIVYNFIGGTKTSETMISDERQIKTAREVRVAMVVDEFTYESLRHECQAIYLSPDNWLQMMQLNKPDVFFCESAWSGKDSDKREWKGKVYSSVNFKTENRNELLQIIQYCKDNGIKTVFWNKEDPSHYDDRVHNFVDTAKKFDYIFTTAEECVDRYKSEHQHKDVYSLMFAVQPRQFNPIETCNRTDEFIFAGSYYRQHPSRCEVMDKMFRLINEVSENKLVIYNRQSQNDDVNHKFPEEFSTFVRPRLPYTQLDKAYKGSKFSININTETQSTTMFARRVFELMASNTLVISNYSAGLDKHFGDLLYLLNSDTEVQGRDVLKQAVISDYEKQRLRALRFVLRNHTYEDRLIDVFNKIGITVEKQQNKVYVVMFVNNEQELIQSIDVFENQNYGNKKLLIINQENSPLETAEWLSKYGSSTIQIIDIHMINNYNKRFIDFIDSEYVAFMSQDYYYGNNYLVDLLLAYKYVDEYTIVVKNPAEKPYRFTNGGSMFSAVLPIRSLVAFEFNQDEDSIVDELFEVGFRVFNCDPYNILSPKMKNKDNIVRVTI